MKRTLAIILCSFMLACSTLLCACGNKNDNKNINEFEKQGYTAVCSIIYYFGNSSYKLNSQYWYDYEIQEITKDEYDELNYEIFTYNPDINSVYKYTNTKSTKYNKGKYKQEYFDMDDEKKYREYTIKEIKDFFIYVKICNNGSTVKIYDSYKKSLTETYCSDYEIEYFI